MPGGTSVKTDVSGLDHPSVLHPPFMMGDRYVKYSGACDSIFQISGGNKSLMMVGSLYITYISSAVVNKH